MHDARPKDTIRDAFEAMLAFLTILIGGPMPRSWPDIATAAAKGLGSQARTTEEAERAVAAIAALRDLIQRAAEEHSRPQIEPAAAADTWPPTRIAEALERCERATPGPWVHSPPGVDEPHVSTKIGSDSDRVDWIASPRSAPSKRWHDAAFVAHAREDLPAAIAEIERLNRLVVATANADPSWVERCTTQAAEIERLATALQAERAAWQEASGADSPGHLTAALKARRARLTAVLCERTSDLADEVRALRGERDQSAHTIAALQAERESENEGARRLMARVAALESELAARPAPAADASLEALGRIVRAAWVEVAKKEAKTVPGYVDLWKWLEIPDADTDRKIGEQVVRAVDASRTAPQPQEDDASLESRGDAARRAFSRASNCGEPSPWDRAVPVERRGWIAAVKSADASRPGLTEEQAREIAEDVATSFNARWSIGLGQGPLKDMADRIEAGVLRASRGETGPARVDTVWTGISVIARPAPDPRATLHAGDPAAPDPRVDYSDGMRPAVTGGECAKCLHAPPLHERTCPTLARRPR